MSPLLVFLEGWINADTVLLLVITAVVVFNLYLAAYMTRKLRLIEHTLQELKKDQSVMSDELEIVAVSQGQKR